jgi:hypothetical protein
MIGCRALTLVEVLASLALLSGVAAASVALVQSSGRTAATGARRIAWDRAADAVMASIAADLAIADLDPVGDRARGDLRVRVVDRERPSLAIRTRSAAGQPQVRSYILEGDRLLVKSEIAGAAPADLSIGDRQAVALGDVATLLVRLDADGGTLQVTIERTSGACRAASFAIDSRAHP